MARSLSLLAVLAFVVLAAGASPVQAGYPRNGVLLFSGKTPVPQSYDRRVSSSVIVGRRVSSHAPSRHVPS